MASTSAAAATVERTAILRFRWSRHQLDRPPASADPVALDVDLLDVGVQDTGPDGSPWALRLRGLDPTDEATAGLALAWTLRGAPHAYRRADLGAVAVATKHELVLAIIGGLFVAETLSVIIQVAWFKRTGRRIFLMAPIHHHFEKLGWSESTVVIRFWIVAVMLALLGLATLKIR